MKTQTHYTTPITATPWRQWGARVLAALLVLMAVSFVLIYALRLSHNSTAVIPAAHLRVSIPIPRVFRDEVLGADQANLAWLVASSAPVLPAARQHGPLERVFRDEVLGADQANLGSTTIPVGVTLEAQQDHLRQPGPR